MNLHSLTDREKECLRLLLHPMKAKDIARATGLSIHTVNEHLKSARRKLGTTDSLTAAKILREREGPPIVWIPRSRDRHPTSIPANPIPPKLQQEARVWSADGFSSHSSAPVGRGTIFVCRGELSGRSFSSA
jgi:DNA-binding CsgD family transcriptional regulator